MKIDDAVAIATRMAHAVLEDMARTSKGAPRFGTIMTCYRGEIPVAMLTLPPNRDVILQTAFLAARGFGPDLLALTHDTYFASAQAEEFKDPRTGKEWVVNPDGPGTMQTYVEEFGYDGTVVDALVTHAVNRAGDHKVVVEPYEVDARKVSWLELGERSQDAHTEGGLQAALLRIMGMTTLDQVLPTAMPQWAREEALSNPERARWSYDMATVTAIEEKMPGQVTVSLYAHRGSPRDQALRRKFPRSQVIDPRRWN